MELVSFRTLRTLLAASAATMLLAALAHAGGLGGLNRSVGGVMIDAEGFVRAATVDEQRELANLMRVAVDQPQGDMAEAAELRMVSLKGLQDAVRENKETGGPLPEAVEFLAGLQRIEYVFVDEKNQDLILAGPAEPWVLREDGSVVGKISGGATLRLDDLAVAMRAIESAREQRISCSIEPTDEGRRRLQQLLRRVRLQPGQNPSMLEPAMREAYGPQTIRLSGIPADSRYARTLVAADFEMKRIAMQLIDSPVAGLPSYLQMSKDSSHSASQNPRWWMACNYDAIKRSEDRLAWQIAGQGVKTLTEQDLVQSDGSVVESGRSDKIAARWAELMTEKFAGLAQAMPVFQDLRNAMDLTVVATLIVQEGLADRAGLDLSVLTGREDAIELARFAVPQAVEPQCSFVRGRAGWVVTTSGGVDINAFEVVANQTSDAGVSDVRTTALQREETNRWWWNG